jgi:hypothetical protein
MGRSHLMSSAEAQWTLEQLHEHLQAAVDLEFWTIPFYMAAAYSIKDQGEEAFQLILSVVNQEMLHVQLAGNIAKAYGLSPKFKNPVYKGAQIPHLDFSLDHPNPQTSFPAARAEIGQLDIARLHAFCLVEYPFWDTGRPVNANPDVFAYGSIGEFYQAVSVGAAQLQDQIRISGQVNHFQRFYADFEQPTITATGEEGLKQVANLVDAITSQGEGTQNLSKVKKLPNSSQPDLNAYFDGTDRTPIKKEFRNTADDIQPAWPHFDKFFSIVKGGVLPETYAAERHPRQGTAGYEAQVRLVENFTAFRHALEALFDDKEVPNFYVHMVTLAGNILACWQNKAVPAFSHRDLAHSTEAAARFAAMDSHPEFPLARRARPSASAPKEVEPVTA